MYNLVKRYEASTLVGCEDLMPRQTLALSIALHHLANVADSSILWMDTTGDFPLQNATQTLYSQESEVTIYVYLP
jgi:hypothetical protein